LFILLATTWFSEQLLLRNTCFGFCMASGLLMLLDDIASVLDDVATMTKVAVKKTSGVLGDDLALNAQQVVGVDPGRELKVVWAVAKGSLVNKAILVPAAILLSWLAPWLITPLLIIGGAYLCFEGVEKVLHSWLHQHSSDEHDSEEPTPSQRITPEIERTKIQGAVRTDFILSAEIIVITLGTLVAATPQVRIAVLVSVALLMTVGVYGLVAAIVKLDDLGAWMIKRANGKPGLMSMLGYAILKSMPYLMKTLSIAGTTAMFLVGGGILVHGVPALHHAIEDYVAHPLEAISGWLSFFGVHTAEGVVGIGIGLLVLAVVSIGKLPFKKKASSH
jgi:uncharacterized protein